MYGNIRADKTLINILKRSFGLGKTKITSVYNYSLIKK